MQEAPIDPTLTEFAKYGAFALLAVLVIYGLGRALVFMFKKYDEAQNKRIEQGEKALATMAANTAAIQNNTAAIQALGEIVKARGT